MGATLRNKIQSTFIVLWEAKLNSTSAVMALHMDFCFLLGVVFLRNKADSFFPLC